jgi:hypothetical protein
MKKSAYLGFASAQVAGAKPSLVETSRAARTSSCASLSMMASPSRLAGPRMARQPSLNLGTP